MSKFTRRILLATFISAAGFVTTFAWYHFTGTKNLGSTNAKPVARLVTLVNEVQRKQVTKLIWQPIAENEILYAGEAIRTGSDAEAAIEFLNSQTRIDLEPDSAIVLEESTNGQLALNFISGNMYVKSEDGSASGITLKSGDKNIALGKSEVSLGKAAGTDLNFQVLKGTAQIDINGKSVMLDESKSMQGGKIIELLKPSSDRPIFIDPDKKELVEFTWTPIPDTYKIYVEAGPTRNSLLPIDGAIANGPAGKISATMKMGRVYYRLVGKHTDPAQPQMESPIFKNSVFAKTPPQLLEPENDQKIAVNVQQPTLKFAWTNPSDFEKSVFEIGSDIELKQIAFKKEVVGSSEYFLDIKTPGKYYWRVSGYLKGIPDPALSNVGAFLLQVNQQLPSPKMIFPLASEKVPFERFKEAGVPFEWEGVSGVVGYVLNIKLSGAARTPAVEPIEVKTKLTKVRVKGLSPGAYAWTVTSVSKKEQSKPSEVTAFEITELPNLPWADNKTLDEQFFLTLKPTADLKWTQGPQGTAQYKLRFIAEGEKFTPDSFTKILTTLDAEIEFPKEGRYFIEVEALNSKDEAIARTPRRTLKIVSAPLLPAPQYADATPAQVEASNTGLANIHWQNVPGANEYVLSVKKSDGNLMKEYRFNQVAGALKGLMPGDYKISLKSVDQHGRQGPEGEERALRVPATSGVRAPKVKGFKVK